MNKKTQQKGKQSNKGLSRAQGENKGGQKGGGGKGGGGGKSVKKQKLKVTVKKLRPIPRTPQTTTPSQGNRSSRRTEVSFRNRPQPSQSQTITLQSAGIKSRLGAKGKGKQIKQIFTSHGQNRGGGKNTDRDTTGAGKAGQRPGNRLKIIRYWEGLFISERY